MKEYVLVIDIGTTNIKVALFDLEANLISTYKQKSINIEEENNHGISPDIWWSAVTENIKKISIQERLRVHSISITGEGPTIVPLSQKGESNVKAIRWLDNKPNDRIPELIKEVGDPQIASVIAKLEEMNDEISEPCYLLQPADFICYKFTNKIINMSVAAKGYIPWTKEILQKFNLNDKFIIPDLVPTGKIVGKISKTISSQLSLPEDAVVVSGAPDFVAALVGTCTLKHGDLCDRGGTSEGVTLCSSKELEIKGLLTSPYFIKNLWKISGVMNTTGAAIDWFSNRVLKVDDITEVQKYLLTVQRPTNIIFLPYLNGERSPHWNSSARSIFFGLTLNTDKYKMLVSVMEGIAFSIMDIVERMESAGCEIIKVRVTGGQATNNLLNQIKADVLNKEIEVPAIPEAELLGTAIFAISAIKDENIVNMSNKLVKTKQTFTPIKTNHEKYQKLFKIYKDLYVDNLKSFVSISKFQKIFAKEKFK